MDVKIAPSVLSADFAILGDQVREVEAAGADQIHVDVMDGHFVPNLSMGPVVVEALKRVTDLPLDVHLMISEPEKYLDSFIDAGANHISWHWEASGDPRAMAEKLRGRGVGAGLVLNPDTVLADVGLKAEIRGILPLLDMVLVMTVHPGFSGQGFLAENLEKVTLVREYAEELEAQGQRQGKLDIEVDGGIDVRTVVPARRAGANVFVAGSAIFGQPSPGDAVRELRRVLEMACAGNATE